MFFIALSLIGTNKGTSIGTERVTGTVGGAGTVVCTETVGDTGTFICGAGTFICGAGTFICGADERSLAA